METARVRPEPPLIVIVGPTASGKTALAVELAEAYGGEIICADSRTLYKGMDIGTAKPSVEDQARVPHWGLDLVEPGERFTAADFKRYAERKINEIRQRGGVPFLVGGTGLYVDAVVFNYQFGPPSDELLRRQLDKCSIEELHKYCIKNNIVLPENSTNKRYVIRAIEQKSINTRRRKDPISNSIIVGIATDRDVLRTRIAQRAEQLFNDNVVEEAIKLGKKYGWDSEAMTGNVYPVVQQYFNGELSEETMKERFRILDWQLAKRQLTWLKRNEYVRWLSLTEAKIYLQSVLASE